MKPLEGPGPTNVRRCVSDHPASEDSRDRGLTRERKTPHVSIPTCRFVLPMHIDSLQPNLLFCWLSEGMNQCTGGDVPSDVVALGSPMSACVRRPVPFTHPLPWAGSQKRGFNPTPPPPRVSHTFPHHPQTSSDQHSGA